MLKVGIIDSGIGEHIDLPIHNARSFRWSENGIVTSDKVISDNDTGDYDIQDQLGHGSAMTEIISQKSPQIALLIAKVFFQKLACTPAQIASALDWQIAEGAKLINMSFGLHADRLILKQACRRAMEAGVILVAASPARGDPVYPAAYPGVIRATGDARCGQTEISYLNSPQADFGGHVRAGHDIAGASVGCAYVSSALINILLEQANLNPADLINALVSQAGYLGPENRSAEFMSIYHD